MSEATANRCSHCGCPDLPARRKVALPNGRVRCERVCRHCGRLNLTIENPEEHPGAEDLPPELGRTFLGKLKAFLGL